MEGAALAGFAFHPNAPAMQFNQFVAQIKAKSDALVGGGISILDLIQAVENARLFFRRDAATRITD